MSVLTDSAAKAAMYTPANPGMYTVYTPFGARRLWVTKERYQPLYYGVLWLVFCLLIGFAGIVWSFTQTLVPLPGSFLLAIGVILLDLAILGQPAASNLAQAFMMIDASLERVEKS